MTLEQALEQLKPYSPDIPYDALECIRNSWHDAVPLLLTELDRCIDRPLDDDQAALFPYALYLCAEMRCDAAFERYERILCLPNLLLDHLIGDILTEHMPDMLARTCSGRFARLKAIIEDETVNEFARSMALAALKTLVADGSFAIEELRSYCLALLTHKLERRPSFVWDETVSLAGDLRIREALPLVERAYRHCLANPGSQTFESIESVLSEPRGQQELFSLQDGYADFDTVHAMSFFTRNWGKHDCIDEPDLDRLLQQRRQTRRQKLPGHGEKIGRNEPCPCGSGKKYKKCCIDRQVLSFAAHQMTDLEPSSLVNECLAAGYECHEEQNDHLAFMFWRRAWQEMRDVLPADVIDPNAEACATLFTGCDFLNNWLQDYQLVIENNLARNLDIARDGLLFCRQVIDRFPALHPLVKSNFQVTIVYLLLALGRSEDAFSQLQQVVEQNPASAQGYVVWADLLSCGSPNFNLRADYHRAQQLLKEALEKAANCEGWDVEMRLAELAASVTICDDRDWN